MDVKTNSTPTELNEADARSPSSAAPSGSLLSLKFPGHPRIIDRARQILVDPRARIDNLARCLGQDPVIGLELMKAANQMFENKSLPAIISTRPAIIRLGSTKLLEHLDELQSLPSNSDAASLNEIERLRLLGRRTSIIAGFIAGISHAQLFTAVGTTAAMSTLGHMLICNKLGQDYIKLAADHRWSALNYRLTANFKINPKTTLRRYLLGQAFPAHLTVGLDRDDLTKNPEVADYCFILESAAELIEAFDFNKWGKYHPNVSIPNYSSLRLLQLSKPQYLQLYEVCDKYLHLVKHEIEKHQSEPDPYARYESSFGIEAAEVLRREEEDTEAASELVQPQEHLTIGDLPLTELAAAEAASAIASSEQLAESGIVPSLVFKSPPEEQLKASFEKSPQVEHRSFVPAALKEKPQFIVLDDSGSRLPAYFDNDPGNVLGDILRICQAVTSTEELLNQLLDALSKNGPFKRAALLIVNETRDTAKVHLGFGPGLEQGRTIEIEDPFSPLAACQTFVKSFNTSGGIDKSAPLGVSSFAISPLAVEGAQPVVLYVDCGENHSISFEARRIFRYAVGLINKALQQLPT